MRGSLACVGLPGMKLLPQPEALRGTRFGWADLVVILAVLVLLGLIARVGSEGMVSFQPPDVSPTVSLDLRHLPDYALRSGLRMFIALGCSNLFTLIYGSLAAHNRRAERVLIPLLDILQSVPVLGIFLARPLPHVRVGGISGLLEWMHEQGDGLRDIPLLAERLQLEVDDLLPLLDAAKLLGFADVADGDVRLTPVGRHFATTTILRSKDLFRQQALERVPVISSILNTLQHKGDGTLRSDFFLDIWDDYFPSEEAERQLATAVNWGRYAELFEFDAGEGRLSLPS